MRPVQRVHSYQGKGNASDLGHIDFEGSEGLAYCTAKALPDETPSSRCTLFMQTRTVARTLTRIRLFLTSALVADVDIWRERRNQPRREGKSRSPHRPAGSDPLAWQAAELLVLTSWLPMPKASGHDCGRSGAAGLGRDWRSDDEANDADARVPDCG